MAAIKLIGFIGEQPRVLARLMPETAAQAAYNTRLDDGGLTPMRRPADIATADEPDCRTIYRHQGEWYCWQDDIHAAPGPVAQDRLYFTGDGVPKVRLGEDLYPLAVPKPAAALTATLGGSGSGDVTTRIYVYTWVTEFGEESEPSAVSNALDWRPGNTVTLSGFGSTPSGRAITHQRIYRSQTGQSGTYFYLIAERTASTGDFTDNIAVDAFQEPLPSATWNAPPDDLEGLTALPNGMMAAFVGRDLYFCEPWRPHAWPEKYVLTTDFPIVGLGALGSAIVVLTTGNPYMVQGTSPDTMQMLKLEQNFPCINGRGIVDLGYAVAYPSNDGLVVVRADGSFQIATANIFDRDRWLAFQPSTLIGAQLQGRYAAFYRATAPDGSISTGCALIDIGGEAFLVRADVQATAAFHDIETSSLYFLQRGTTKIRQLDAPNAARALQYWKSKEFVPGFATSFGAIRIDSSTPVTPADEAAYEADKAAAIQANETAIAAGSIAGEMNAGPLGTNTLNGDNLEPMPRLTNTTLNVGVYADKKHVATIATAGKIVRLPAGFKARTWEIDVFGDVPIEQIVMARTVDELKAAG